MYHIDSALAMLRARKQKDNRPSGKPQGHKCTRLNQRKLPQHPRPNRSKGALERSRATSGGRNSKAQKADYSEQIHLRKQEGDAEVLVVDHLLFVVSGIRYDIHEKTYYFTYCFERPRHNEM